MRELIARLSALQCMHSCVHGGNGERVPAHRLAGPQPCGVYHYAVAVFISDRDLLAQWHRGQSQHKSSPSRLYWYAFAS